MTQHGARPTGRKSAASGASGTSGASATKDPAAGQSDANGAPATKPTRAARRGGSNGATARAKRVTKPQLSIVSSNGTTIAAAPGRRTADKDLPLREDIRFLGRLLGECLREQEGDAAFEVVETIRQTAVRFRRVGIPQLYCTYARTAVFASGIITNMDDSAFRQEVGNVGAQIDFRLVIFSALESTLSFGYAAAKEESHRMDTEFMISLKIL